MAFRRPVPPFKGRRRSVEVHLADAERELLARLLDDVAGMLEPEPQNPPDDSQTPHATPEWQLLEQAMAAPAPSDPAVARLLPDGHRDDAELAQSYRRLTEHSLREAKQAALTTAAAALRREAPVVLDEKESVALLKGLNDVRLVIAERLDLRTDTDAEQLHVRLAMAGPYEQSHDEPDEPDDEPDGERYREPDSEWEQAERHWLQLAAIYEALTWWQEALVAAVR